MRTRDPNLLAWMTDTHVVKDNATGGVLGETHPQEARSFARILRALGVWGAFNSGDLVDHYEASTHGQNDDKNAEYVQYDAFAKLVPWLPVNKPIVSVAGVLETINAKRPQIPGNHDKKLDSGESTLGANNYTTHDAHEWGPPYHLTCDWPAAKIRLMLAHSDIEQQGVDPNPGSFRVLQAETDWLAAHLAALPAGWKAIPVTHAPILNAFGGGSIAGTEGGAALKALIDANAAKIVCCLSGHRHTDNEKHQAGSGVWHISGTCLAYTNGPPANSNGGFNLIKFKPGDNTITFHYRLGPTSFHAEYDSTVYTPLVLPV